MIIIFYLINENLLRISISQIGITFDQLVHAKTKMKFSSKIFQNEKKIKGKISVNFRILFYYLQMVSIIQNIKFQWPIFVAQYLNFFSYLSFTNQIFSFDCFSFEYGISFSTIYIKLIFTQIIPFVVCSIFISYFWFFPCGNKRKEIQFTKLVVVIFVVFTYSQLSTISMLFEMISCLQINDLSYLNSDFHFVCWTNEHENWGSSSNGRALA